MNVLASWLPEVGDDSGRLQLFRSLDRRLSLEIVAWERREVESSNTMYTRHLQELKGDGVVSRYRHLGYDVLLARIDYHSEEMPENPTIPPARSAGEDLPLELEGRLETAESKEDAEPNKEKANAVAYVFYFYGAQYAYRVASIGPRNATPLELDIQYSVLDSFGFEGHNHWNQGPVSGFFLHRKTQAQEKAQNPESEDGAGGAGSGKAPRVDSGRTPMRFTTWYLGPHSFRTQQKPTAEQVARDVLKREKRILDATIPKLYSYALVRFYYMNFRQNYQFFRNLAKFLENKYRELASAEPRKERLPTYEYLLYDLQVMLLDSDRKKAASLKVPLELPGDALAAGVGNIETLALIYVMLISHFQHSGLILYSPEYSQLLVGVEELGVKQELLAQRYSTKRNRRKFKKYNGIVISWYKNRYLIGELTAKIYIGWARTPLRDLRKWVPLPFPRYTIPNFFP
ncbi:hypothetical protein P0082_07410 [Candidatus Haliotispira prima]|uniref:WYL domain-containing protein n=1 Tax=Candidatus Haliotispira prima TaxID=3034016 RepID=A0ABY8MGH5_9SPIO|nr:hypothetical protein P0082_07410 [Candidatus Haliotispira prima]